MVTDCGGSNAGPDPGYVRTLASGQEPSLPSIGFRVVFPTKMHNWLPNIGLVSAALSLALLSSEVESTGPELVQDGNICGPTFNEPCLKPVLKGGFPVAYLFDVPGVSVQGKLSFGEDEFRPAAFVLDAGVYFAVMLLIAYAGALRRSARPGGASAGS